MNERPRSSGGRFLGQGRQPPVKRTLMQIISVIYCKILASKDLDAIAPRCLSAFRSMKLFTSSLLAPALLRALSLPATAAQPEPPATALPPVVVTASPLERTLFEQAQPVSILEGEKLTLSLEPTLG